MEKWMQEVDLGQSQASAFFVCLWRQDLRRQSRLASCFTLPSAVIKGPRHSAWLGLGLITCLPRRDFNSKRLVCLPVSRRTSKPSSLLMLMAALSYNQLVNCFRLTNDGREWIDQLTFSPKFILWPLGLLNQLSSVKQGANSYGVTKSEEQLFTHAGQGQSRLCFSVDYYQ